MAPDESDEAETLYENAHRPDPGNARDVLAFVLTPTRAFISKRCEPDELQAVEDIMTDAKREAIERWAKLNGVR